MIETTPATGTNHIFTSHGRHQLYRPTGTPTQLFFHLISKDDKKVTQLCSSHREGPLQRISVYNDTVLHMASRFKRSKLVRDLLEMLPKECNHKLAATENNAGSNILHEVAASDTMKDVAEEMLKRDPELLIARNDLGETPIFCAARYGQTEMFKFLAGEMKLTERNPEDGKQYLQRNDRTTVLHISIFTECFGEFFSQFICKFFPIISISIIKYRNYRLSQV
ncbi:hypothetical protein CK203_066365 [Vitis vinifera]|uniref:Uncharacterized protein n=1 Tax=Vitis vinifera TaxID=29760 RepID=A0A438FY25_VITVI|nr:hypothetical protein CK203_066365 [Vitis vinifera]